MNTLKLLILIAVIVPINAVFEQQRISTIKHEVATAYSHNRLIAAICTEDIQQVKSLLDKGAQVNTQEEDGITPLAVAVIYGNAEIIQLLVHNGAAFNDATYYLLYMAQQFGYTYIMPLLKTYMRAERISKFKQSVLADGNHDRLIEAICSENLERVEALLATGVDVNAPNDNNLTPLQVAIGCENQEMVTLLLHKGADIHAGLVLLRTIQMQMGDIQLVKILLEHGADVNEVDEYNVTPLMYAVASPLYDNDTIELIELLLAHGADINARCDSRVMGIHLYNGFLAYAHDLSGGEFNKRGQSVLMQAGNIDIIKLLLDKGAEVNTTPCYWGKVPLVQALRCADAYELVSLLLHHGADVNVQFDRENTTPLIDAIKNGVESRVIGLLIVHGARVSVQDSNGYNSGYSPLMYAVARNDIEIVQLLLAADPDLTAHSSAAVVFDDNGRWRSMHYTNEGPKKTALDIAKEKGNQLIIALLEQKFAE
jgi:ankyrin repeat protein